MSDTEDGESPLAQRRSRRDKKDKGGRLAALEKLRNARMGGVKNKYEVKEMENVYDVVDEETYSKRVNERLKDDWIEDDGTGYLETGQELFDDDLMDDEEEESRQRKKQKNRKKEGPSKEEKESQKANFLSVRDMLTNMPTKKAKREEPASSSSSARAEADDLMDVDQLLEELHGEKKKRPGAGGEGKERLVNQLKSSGPGKRKKPDSMDLDMDSLLSELQKDSKKSEEKRKSSLAEEKKKVSSIFNISATACNSSSYSSKRKREEEDEMEIGGFEPEPEPSVVNIKKEKEDEVQVKVQLNLKTKEEAPARKPTKKPTLEEDKRKLSFLMDSCMTKSEQQEPDVVEVPAECSGSGVSAPTADGTELNIYWFDLYEEIRNPGFLYLFGKVAKKDAPTGFVSCCVVIQNVERTIYFLPRETMLNDETEDVDFPQVYEEVQKLLQKQKVHEFRSRQVEKKYCFGEPGIPSQADYLEVTYPGTFPPLSEDLQGNTFSRVFGTHSSLLENFVLKKKFKGPCWLQISNAVPVESAQQQSWCKMEFTCTVKDITINPKSSSMGFPTFTVASLNVNSVNDPATKRENIISLSASISKTFKIQSSVSNDALFQESFCLLNKPQGEIWPMDLDRVLPKCVTKMESERSMLACFLAKLMQFDPDIYVGHDLNFDLLLLQLWTHKVPHWSKIGRLKRSSQTHKGAGGKLPDSRAAIAGRLACDVKVSAMELIRARSYDLPSLASQVLGINEDQIPTYTGPELKQFFDSSEGIQHLVNWGTSLSILNLRLVNELQIMPLALQITAIAGNTLSRTLMGGRSERNEFLLLHAFYNKNYIVPDKQYKKKFKKEDDEDPAGGEKDDKKGKSGGPSYVGGLVLEPKRGFYDHFIVLMDFNSLYPSIIQEFNVCFTTETTDSYTDESVRGILPEEIRILVQSRREVKKLMQSESASQDQKKQYDIRQKALKLTANSMYGCLGFQHSRFYAKHLAALITGRGRDILMKTKEVVEKMGFDVIYGDTDSIMINSNSRDIKVVYQIGNKIKTEINRMYKLLELEIDGVFRFLLLLKKKKYAALTYSIKSNGEAETAMELKGLDIVRRDWAPIAATTARSILDEIMTEQELDDKTSKILDILRSKAEQLRNGDVHPKDLVITKQLAKAPEEYKDRQSLYHVHVALRMNQAGMLPRKLKSGDTVPYIFCTDGQPHHPVEILQSRNKEAEAVVQEKSEEGTEVKPELKPVVALEPDSNYYLSQQVHPVVSRICEPIPGLDAGVIADALGLDPKAYRRRRVEIGNHHEDFTLGEITEEENFRECARFTFPCAFCKTAVKIESPIREEGGMKILALSKCPGCSVPLYNQKAHISNNLVLFMRKFIQKYYQGWYLCEDPACYYKERAVNLHLQKGYMICPCQQGVMIRDYTEQNLSKQLDYLLYVFDCTRWEDKEKDVLKEMDPKNLQETKTVFEYLCKVVKKQVDKSAFSEIKLGELFLDLIPKSKFTFNRR